MESAISDYVWVNKIISSCVTTDHYTVAKNVISLWEKKHISNTSKLNGKNKNFLLSLLSDLQKSIPF